MFQVTFMIIILCFIYLYTRIYWALSTNCNGRPQFISHYRWLTLLKQPAEFCQLTTSNENNAYRVYSPHVCLFIVIKCEDWWGSKRGPHKWRPTEGNNYVCKGNHTVSTATCFLLTLSLPSFKNCQASCQIYCHQ